jgi:hypothetical protein
MGGLVGNARPQRAQKRAWGALGELQFGQKLEFISKPSYEI